MTRREELEQILDLETPHAEDGCSRSRSLVINAQAELDEMPLSRHEVMVAQAESERDFWNEQDQVSDDLPEEVVEDWGHHDQWGH